MEPIHNASLTSAEISQLWASYQNDTLAICVMKHFLQIVEDPDIAAILEESLELSQSHIPILTNFFNGENWPVPQGFTENDVDLSAPRLVTDHFMLYYIQQMGTVGINGYSMALSLATRQDLHTYYKNCMTESMNLQAKSNELLLKKGFYIRAPQLTPPSGIDFVTDQKFLGGWFGENRPLATLEIAHMFANVQRNVLGRSLMMAFSQVTSTQKIRDHMVKGKELAQKQITQFASKLNDNDIQSPITSDADVTHSTYAPFSDKLMMYHTNALIGASIAYYGTSMAQSLRKDLQLAYTKQIAEIMKYASDSVKIMIENGWMEEPPMSVDRDQLARKKD
ncbi:DUF3231 family protein [Lentibacillus jeotgali]|uniref:DUF3231 family protein n=1 Tax=Lentibacillus jeotgali TaxID=558169 RepID=UPI000262743F|nr:DUF3231 family protein [Lentibacillus jeotgali]